MRRKEKLLALAAASLLAAHLGSGCAGGFGGRCETHEDCADGEICDAGGSCREISFECEHDGDCEPGYGCENGSCVSGELSCSADEDCEGGLVCDAGTCREPEADCVDDEDCEGGLVCEGGICGEASPECVTGADCGEGASCEDGRCEPLTCEPDPLDGNNETIEQTVHLYLGANDVHVSDLSASSEIHPPRICPDDIDWFLFGHMGGSIEVGASHPAAYGNLIGEVFVAELTIAGQSISISKGPMVGSLPLNREELERGMYALRFKGDGVSPTGIEYQFWITHQCRADQWDSPLVELDDELEKDARPFAYSHIRRDAALDRVVCGGDVDVMSLYNMARGDIVVSLLGGAGLEVEAHKVETGPIPVEDLQVDLEGDDLVLTIPDAPAGAEYTVTVRAPEGVISNFDYGFSVFFEGLALDNETCAGAEALPLSTGAGEAAAAESWTIGALHHVVGPCGNELMAVEEGKDGAGDVFYLLDVPEEMDVRLTFDGRADRFEGQIYLFEAKEECPADLSSLQPVRGTDGEPVCETGRIATLYLPRLPAGEYLVVVDGVYVPPLLWFDEYWTMGAFTLEARGYPDGFPEPDYCLEAEALDLPEAGEWLAFSLDTTTLTNEVESYPCTSGGRGNDKVYSITPEHDLTLTVRATGFDTILSLMEGSCILGHGRVVDCNDAVDYFGGDLSSLIIGRLEAGKTYYLFVDGFDVGDVGVVEIEIRVG